MQRTHDDSGGVPEPDGSGAVVHPSGGTELIREHYHRLEALAKRRELADAAGEAANATALCLSVLGERALHRAGTAAEAERESRLRAALQELACEAPRRAECLTLHALAGMPSDAIADLLGIGSGEVDAHVEAGRRWLAVRMR